MGGMSEVKITVAIDSFKGSLSSQEAGEAVREAAGAVYPDADVSVIPLADGGEGTAEALLAARGGRVRTVTVSGPLGKKVDASYSILPDNTAVIEMSAAAGITLISDKERDPMRATTFGVGELLSDAIGEGCRKLIIGIGGSATNDGGAGMLAALGYKLLDKEENPIPIGASGLSVLEGIDLSQADPRIKECDILVACDVENPLVGPLGASAVFGPQKGASTEDVKLLDGWLSKFASITKETLGVDHSADKGAGAAGGLGFALIAYLGARLTSGIELVMRESGLEKHIIDSDIVFTGEGRLDRQSAMGKAPAGVAKLARKHGKPVIALSGAVAEGAEGLHTQGVDAYFPIAHGACSLAEAMDKPTAFRNLKRTAEQVLRLWRAAGK